MDKIYLFGAGKNGQNAIDFFGKENIIAIIDNSVNQIGRKIMMYWLYHYLIA